MGSFTYRDGIAVFQLIVFPIILVAAVMIWHQTGWRVGSKIWRFPVTLSLLRIAGGICSMLALKWQTYNIEVAIVVCELIGLTPLLLTYVGLLRQIDTMQRIQPRYHKLLTIICFIGLILGISGISSANSGDYTPDAMVKGAMGIYIAVFVILLLTTVWLWTLHSSSFTMKKFQKKLFLAIALSTPFLAVRLAYSALGDYTTIGTFSVISGNTTVYLVMDVLEEMAAMGITMILGLQAVHETDYIKVSLDDPNADPKIEGV
ncbi:hypothetical protein ASPZODRAFT_70272 [Penicilliopsis zonata CBS 506.65]|uniref:DUF7702 domain-containing protein n=1 Tax=Penicilliopsis zonata CBS 506.65 TaxID=1073090 RepID=A0A1L9SD65_9EURO|nr:hypothetical protein ASPZODRAFT_70272 [Penicilliopsis zonata CBS 506.65]OJJ45165.1 hypothetical protein ASPZODRAFT_70272 [Penicilliopsis zonata CBS 506.65]